MRDYADDDRVVLTLDAGGTNFVFGAMAGHEPAAAALTLPARADELEASLATMVEGFERVRAECPRPPVAIGFAFPGPSDYARGIVVAPPNLDSVPQRSPGPDARGPFRAAGVHQQRWRPVRRWRGGGRPPARRERQARARGQPEAVPEPRRVHDGTGFGCGIVHKGALYTGDNSLGGEVWLLRHKLVPGTNVEEGVSIRAVRAATPRMRAWRLPYPTEADCGNRQG